MNCKPGDLAIVVRSFPGDVLKAGFVVTCIEVHDGLFSALDGEFYRNVWFVDHNGNKKAPNGCPLGVPDAYLRPIRPGDLEGETPTVRELEAA